MKKDKLKDGLRKDTKGSSEWEGWGTALKPAHEPICMARKPLGEYTFKKMRVLVACEESQTVCKAFRKLGHDAYSCDILPCSGGHPEWHIQGDVLEHLNDGWDMMIAHPPCTYFSNAGMCNMTRKNSDDAYRKNRIRLRDESFDFFLKIANANIPKIAIENPVGYINTHFRKPDQIIQPFQFGHRVNKKTCLWLKNLPLLQPTNIVEKDETVIWEGTGAKISKWYKDTLKEAKGNLKEVSRIRSKTFQGIADAMAEQWGKVDKNFKPLTVAENVLKYGTGGING